MNEVTENPENLPEKTASLAAHVADAKERLKGEALKPVRRKPGRPPGSRDKTKRKTISGTHHNASLDESPEATPAVESFEVPTVMLKPALQFPFRLVATWKKCPAINLTDEEADGLTPLLDEVLKRYCPEMTGPQATLAVFGLSLAMIVASKAMVYAEFKNSIEAPRAPEPRKTQPESIPVVSGENSPAASTAPSLSPDQWNAMFSQLEQKRA